MYVRQSTFKDVLFRVDARLDFPRGTLIRCEHKSTVKKRISGLLVSIPSRSIIHFTPCHSTHPSHLPYICKAQAEEIGDQGSSPPKKRTTRPEHGAGAKSNKRRKADTPASDQEGSDTEPEPKKAKKSRPPPKSKAKETKVVKVKVTKTETKKSDVKLKVSGKPTKPAISAVICPTDIVLFLY